MKNSQLYFLISQVWFGFAFIGHNIWINLIAIFFGVLALWAKDNKKRE